MKEEAEDLLVRMILSVIVLWPLIFLVFLPFPDTWIFTLVISLEMYILLAISIFLVGGAPPLIIVGWLIFIWYEYFDLKRSGYYKD